MEHELKELISWLTPLTGLIDFYMQESSQLEKRDSILRVCDLDDTLCGRADQLTWEEILRLNRWWAGNTIIFNTLWIYDYVEKYYAHISYPTDILSLLNPESDIILTAWMKELQIMKARWAGLEKYTLRVVAEWKDKILEAIRYVLFELKYIPSEIIVYEDRPQFFIEYRTLIEWILWTKLTIMYVEMDGNNGYKKIEAV
jgi:hypothetical protein